MESRDEGDSVNFENVLGWSLTDSGNAWHLLTTDAGVTYTPTRPSPEIYSSGQSFVTGLGWRIGGSPIASWPNWGGQYRTKPL